MQERLDQAVIDAYVLFHVINGGSLSQQVEFALKSEYDKKLKEIDEMEAKLMAG
jgi:hypothetical protein